MYIIANILNFMFMKNGENNFLLDFIILIYNNELQTYE